MREQVILIRCDAAPAIGYGHLVRCLALADELRDRHSCQVIFALKLPQGVPLVQEKGYVVHKIPLSSDAVWDGERDEGDWLQQIIVITGAQALILDVRTDLAAALMPEAIKKLRESGVLIVTIDDPSVHRLVSDLAFYPPVPQVEKLDWTGFTGDLFVGWDWVILRSQFAQVRNSVKKYQKNQPDQSELKVLVTMGGSDPGGLTLLALAGLDELDIAFRTIVVVGRGFMHEAALQQWLTDARRCYDVQRDVADMAALMTSVDLAVASFGVTAYELAALGVPAVYLCLSEDHAKSVKAFVDAGIAMSLGVGDRVSPPQLSQAVMQVLTRQPNRIAMGIRAMELLDGGGGKRIAKIIVNQLVRKPCNTE